MGNSNSNQQTKLPVEVLRQVCQNSFVPRTLIFRCRKFWGTPIGPAGGFEFLGPKEPLPTREICQDSRLETDRYYRTLSVGPSPLPILFNPEIDTLALRCDCDEADAFVSDSMKTLRDLLHRDYENLALTQTIAVGNVRWKSSGGTPGVWDSIVLRYFEASLKDGFRNLSKLILVRPFEPEIMYGCLGPFTVEDSLSTEEGRDICRRQIRQMFEALREEDPGVKVPEVIILDPDDLEAPNLGL